MKNLMLIISLLSILNQAWAKSCSAEEELMLLGLQKCHLKEGSKEIKRCLGQTIYKLDDYLLCQTQYNKALVKMQAAIIDESTPMISKTKTNMK